MWSQVLLMVFLFALLTGALSPFVCMIALVLPVVAVCHQRSSRFCPRLAWCILVLLFDCRVGEASNPGPPLEDNFVMGAFNPSGLRGKAPFFGLALVSWGFMGSVGDTSKPARNQRLPCRFAFCTKFFQMYCRPPSAYTEIQDSSRTMERGCNAFKVPYPSIAHVRTTRGF